MSVDSLFAQWRVVNQQANEAEHRLLETSLTCLRGEGPPPKATDRVLAGQLRAEARSLFVRALARVDAEVESAGSASVSGTAAPGAPQSHEGA